MMKNAVGWCQTPGSVAVKVKPSGVQSFRVRRALRLKRANGQDGQGPPENSQPILRRDKMYHSKVSTTPTLVIQRQEMASYLKLLGE